MLHVSVVFHFSLSDEDQNGKKKHNEKQNEYQIKDDLHFFKMEFSLRRHGKTIELQVSSVEGIQVIDEDVVIGLDESSGVFLIQGLDSRDIIVVEKSQVQPQ